ncbi:hypothetical protein SJ303_16575 [Proteus mirabilis]|uniref:hypothetical protein n=1 Tax=Proteus mirabilis TaxID=584 RepID=UPI001B97DAC2|nr:hypothetical protein [Proteus mirabilis]MDM3784183.1 hypothetical protein [Proteus mirabilis]MDM3824631.1 hypothetical protein [Proteus mirabilis]MDX7299066.1 hypothetical protein [Proteus mirabilis]HBC6002202.1 hypothetical protein [Proteus mirabilis]HEK2815633.1 hypothetical protein [Proteus mirabilis]
MKKIFFVLKILILLFLTLFFLTGLNITFSPDAKNRGASIFMLVVNGALIIVLLRIWFFYKKNTTTKTNITTENTNTHNKKTQPIHDIDSDFQVKESIEAPKTPENIHTEDKTEKVIADNVKTFVMKNGKSLLWQGITNQASFRVRDKTDKIYGIFTRLYIYDDGEFYLELTDPSTGEATYIPEKEIITVITIGSSRYDFKDLCKKKFKLDLHELFEYAKDVRYKAKEIKVVAEFPAIKTTFTYLSNSGKVRRTVDVTQYKKNGYGDEYIAGYCHVRNEHRTFSVRNIQTMMATDGHKKYYFHDWLKNIVGIDVNN